MAGLVPGHSKPGEQVDEDAPSSRSSAPPPYVSRAGHKLANALDAFGVDAAGLDCLDVGASTGGFTDVLLQRGAARVIALDVGYGQLHPRLRGDPRVTVLERTNARVARPSCRSRRSSSRATSRSSRVRLGAAAGARARGARLAGARARQAAVRGRAAPRRRRASSATPRCSGASCARSPRRRSSWAARSRGVVDSGLPGPKGNHEFVLHLVHAERPRAPRRARPVDRRCRRLSARRGRDARPRQDVGAARRARCAPWPRAPASSWSSTTRRPKHGVERARPTPTSRSCSAATARCCARCTRFLGTGVPGDRRQLRPRRLPDGDPGATSSRRRSPASSPATTASIELPTLEVDGRTASTHVAVNDVVVVERHARPDGRARLVDRRRGRSASQPLRRADLRDAGRLDGLQPLERRAGARLGARRDGGHVRRAARAARAAARRRRAAPTSSSRTARRTSTRPCWSTASRSATLAPGGAWPSCGSATQPSLLATLPEVTFFRRYGHASAPPDGWRAAPLDRSRK